MNIQLIPISEIQRAKYNPRKALKPGDPAYDKLKKAVAQFGLVEPLVWNQRTKNLVGGHQRLSVIEERGDIAVEVSVVDLNDREEKALNLALNRHSGEWDFASLADLLTELDAGDLDMEITGFDQAELERLMTWTAPNTGKTDEDVVPEAPAVPTTQKGDLWQLGRHFVLCGDCTAQANVARLLGGVEPGLMVTDPPYGVSYDPGWRDKAASAGLIRFGVSRLGKVDNDDRVDWAEAYAQFPGDIAYVWHAGRHASEVQRSLEASGFEIRCQLIWAKQNFAISRGHYHWRHEPCWYAVRKGQTGQWQGDRKQSTLWEIPNLCPVGGDREETKNNHGTQKPVECMRRPILNHTNPGQSVYDPFVGSGTTIIAAESTGRTCYAMEIDLTYCDVVVKRWENFTGQKALRL